MVHVCDSVRCIVPPHIMRALLEQSDKRLRDIAVRTMLTSARQRERRAILGALPVALSAGEERRTIYDAQLAYRLPGRLVRGEGDPATSDSAVNEAYEGLGATYDLFYEVYRRNSIDNRGMRLDATVHFGTDFDNAFWDGRQMVFGDGDGIIFTGFTRAIDVIGHELTHGVTQFACDLEYHEQSGALNESFSDVFGSLAKQHYNRQNAAAADWLIGADILGSGVSGRALRSMKDPGTAYDDPRLGGRDPQPGHMRSYVKLPDTEEDDWGGVHINSGIPNRAFYLLARELGGNAWDDAGNIWYTSLLRLWPTAQFADCANITFQAAGELFGPGSRQQVAVRDAWSEVGIEVSVRAARPRAEAPRERGAVQHDGERLRRQLERLEDEVHKAVELSRMS